MIRFSKLTLSTIITFALAIVFVMLDLAWTPFIYFALPLFCIGFVLLAIKYFMKANKEFKHSEMIQEELLMELAITDEGEQYVVNKANEKKRKKSLRREKLSLYIPGFVCCFLAGAMLFFLVKVILKF